MISFRPYRRKDGAVMLYINRSNGVSIGISAERGFRPYGAQATQGQRNAMQAAIETFRLNSSKFTGDLSSPEEGTSVYSLSGGWTIALTDVARVCGQDVGQDGAYVIRDGRILRCGTYLEPDEE